MNGRDNEAYWVARHEQQRHKLAAVGDIQSSEERNLELYAEKKRRVVELLRAIGSLDLAGRYVLDAGCGIGVMSELFFALGARVSGVDASSLAVEEARHRCPTGEFLAHSLIDFRLDREFDLTFCIDVLYHVTDDQNWRDVVANLVSHTKPGGVIAILDQHKSEAHSPAEHVRFRTKAMYDEAMSANGAIESGPEDSGMFLVYRRP